jgi:uncharacterized flavoprotein (TIGR03862 family)
MTSVSLTTTPTANTTPRVAVIGGGPAGLMAAEALAQRGLAVDLYDAMPSVGRKFLLAGKGGLNLTHAEAFDRFVTRYAAAGPALEPGLRHFGPDALRAWSESLGIATFVGSSNRVFPQDMKAAPLLRAWLHRLRVQGVRFHMRHRWTGWTADGALQFDSPAGAVQTTPSATVLALGGASWSRLGSDGAWWPWLAAKDVPLAPLQPSNCGFEAAWSEHFSSRYAGEPLKSVAIAFEGWRQPGEFVVTATGVEGSLVYAASAALRDRIAASGSATFHLDLLPARSGDWVQREVAHPRGPRSLATHLKSRLNLSGVKAGLLWELLPKEAQADPVQLAAAIKALPVTVTATRPIDEAISTAGGVRFDGLDPHGMLKNLPGVFVAGEMLDWEAPTGGYLLTACFATGLAAGQGAADWLAESAAGSAAGSEAAAGQ